MTNHSHYNDPIPDDGSDLHGNSRKWGDASIEVKRRIQQKIVEEADRLGLSNKDKANLVAIGKVESGLNPDAATPGTQSSASGVFQVTDSTARDAQNRLDGERPGIFALPEYDRFDPTSNIDYGIAVYLDKKRAAQSDDVGDIYAKYNSNPKEYIPLQGRLRRDSSALESDPGNSAGTGYPPGPAPKFPKNPPLPPERPAEFGHQATPSPFGGLNTDPQHETFDPDKIDQLLKMYKYFQQKKQQHTSARKVDEDVMVVRGPDVCLTPKGGCEVPVAYSSVAHLGKSVRVADTVHVNSYPSFILNSRSTTIEGHSPGKGRGQTVPGYKKYSHTDVASKSVFSEGWAEVRNEDPAWINHPNVGPTEPSVPMETIKIYLLYPLGSPPSMA